jgi:hypothetical protein
MLSRAGYIVTKLSLMPLLNPHVLNGVHRYPWHRNFIFQMNG